MRTFALLLLPICSFSQRMATIETADIRNFWEAFDKLSTARTRADSIQTIQTWYIDRATDDCKKFLKKRGFEADEYVTLIARQPKFWKSIRPLTERIEQRKTEILGVLDQLSKVLPGFKAPDVCFAIGCLRSGGTTKRGLVLIGAEIAAADDSVDKSELNNWLKGVMGKTGDIASMVAHEAVHTQQHGIPWKEFFSMAKHRRMSLLNTAIVEGSADFITMQLLGLNINQGIYDYGEQHQCTLMKEFGKDIEKSPFDYSKWLYNGNSVKERPADLGYFIGFKISEAFYKNASDKQAALELLLRNGKYRKVYKLSGFGQLDCTSG